MYRSGVIVGDGDMGCGSNVTDEEEADEDDDRVVADVDLPAVSSEVAQDFVFEETLEEECDQDDELLVSAHPSDTSSSMTVDPELENVKTIAKIPAFIMTDKGEKQYISHMISSYMKHTGGEKLKTTSRIERVAGKLAHNQKELKVTEIIDVDEGLVFKYDYVAVVVSINQYPTMLLAQIVAVRGAGEKDERLNGISLKELEDSGSCLTVRPLKATHSKSCNNLEKQEDEKQGAAEVTSHEKFQKAAADNAKPKWSTGILTFDGKTAQKEFTGICFRLNAYLKKNLKGFAQFPHVDSLFLMLKQPGTIIVIML